MLFLQRFFGTGHPTVRPETSDRTDYDAGRGLTPEKVDRIMLAANAGDTADQCRLAQEILEKNADIMQAFSTRKNAGNRSSGRSTNCGKSANGTRRGRRTNGEQASGGLNKTGERRDG